MTIKILICDPLHDEGLKILTAEKEFEVDVKAKLSPAELEATI